MTIVNVEEIRALKARLAEINSIPFEQIEWHENGEPLDIHPDILDEWKFVGMTNACFIDTNFYKNGYGGKIVGIHLIHG